MEKITVSTSELRAKADKVNEQATAYMKHYEALLNDVNTFTTTDYKGEAANTFRNQVEGFRQDFVAMKELMDDYADFLRTAAKNYEDTQEQNIRVAKSLKN